MKAGGRRRNWLFPPFMNSHRTTFSPRHLLRAAALGAVLIAAFSGCNKRVPLEKPAPPATITVEVQVFSMPRPEAATIVLNQPVDTDYAAVLQQVQLLVAEEKARLVASPSLGTLSGQRAVVESVLEYRFPTEFSPPQIPQTTGETVRKVTKTTTTVETTSVFPQTPATPTAFDRKDLGTTLEVEPTFSPESKLITIQLSVQFVALQGTSKFTGENGSIIEQPLFYMKKITTNASMKNGGVFFMGTVEPDRTLSKDEDLTEIVFLRCTAR